MFCIRSYWWYMCLDKSVIVRRCGWQSLACCYLTDQLLNAVCYCFNASWWAINKSNSFLGQMQTGGLPPFSETLAFNNTPSCEMASWLADKLKCTQEHLSGFHRLWNCLNVINIRLPFSLFPFSPSFHSKPSINNACCGTWIHLLLDLSLPHKGNWWKQIWFLANAWWHISEAQ